MQFFEVFFSSFFPVSLAQKKKENHIDFDWSGKKRENHIDFVWSGKKRGTKRKNHENHGTEKRGQRESNEGPQSWGPKRLEVLPTELKNVVQYSNILYWKNERKSNRL